MYQGICPGYCLPSCHTPPHAGGSIPQFSSKTSFMLTHSSNGIGQCTSRLINSLARDDAFLVMVFSDSVRLDKNSLDLGQQQCVAEQVACRQIALAWWEQLWRLFPVLLKRSKGVSRSFGSGSLLIWVLVLSLSIWIVIVTSSSSRLGTASYCIF